MCLPISHRIALYIYNGLPAMYHLRLSDVNVQVYPHTEIEKRKKRRKNEQHLCCSRTQSLIYREHRL